MAFRINLLKKLSLGKFQKGDFDKFKFLVNNLLEFHASMKEKYIRRNQASFMNKSIQKAFMVRTCFLNKFRKKFISQWMSVQKTTNFCPKLIKKRKRNFFNNLNVSKINEKLVLVENSTISEENKVKEIFWPYLDGIEDGLNISLILVVDLESQKAL